MANFTYMGTKRLLAPRIAELVTTIADGPFLDLFAGIAAVCSEVGRSRPIWCNDVQQFSSLLSRRRFKSIRPFVTQDLLIKAATPVFARHREGLAHSFAKYLIRERNALRNASCSALNALCTELGETGRKRQERLRKAGYHCLFATTHAGTYFGLLQAIEVDSIRFAADQLLESGHCAEDDHEWMILALCQAISSSSNSTGHFAQYLTPSASNLHRVIRKRRQSIWDTWQAALLSMHPFGSVKWRRSNKVFNLDAEKLLEELGGRSNQPKVIYADPPYTSDQYSRYYHVLENLILYDYPDTSGKGQYRPDRFISGFSLKSAVGDSFLGLIEAAAKIDAALILSYPTNGLLDGSTEQLITLLRGSYKHVENPIVIRHMHSTMGGSKGAYKNAVDENVFIAYPNLRCRRNGARWESSQKGRQALQFNKSYLIERTVRKGLLN